MIRHKKKFESVCQNKHLENVCQMIRLLLVLSDELIDAVVDGLFDGVDVVVHAAAGTALLLLLLLKRRQRHWRLILK